MTSDERARDELLRQLVAVIGEEAESRLMRSLPPDDWSDLARQADLVAMREDIEELRSDVDGLRSDVVRVEHKVDITKLEFLDAFHQQIAGALVTSTRTSIFTMAGSLVGLAGLAMALGRIS